MRKRISWLLTVALGVISLVAVACSQDESPQFPVGPPGQPLLRQLVDMLYERNDMDFHRGTFRVRGDVVEIFPQYEAERALRVEFFGDEVEALAEIDGLNSPTAANNKAAGVSQYQLSNNHGAKIQ